MGVSAPSLKSVKEAEQFKAVGGSTCTGGNRSSTIPVGSVFRMVTFWVAS